MSSTETNASSAPEFMSTRQFAKVSGRQHGNIVSMIRTMIKKRKLRLKESLYRNTEHGQTFVEFQLRQKDFEKLAHRLTEDEMRSVRNYFKPVAYSVEKVVTGGKEIVVTLPAFSFTPESDGVTMSSLEIAELTDKDHKHVLRDIRNMLGKLEKAEAQIWSTAFLPGPNNSSREVEIANLPRDLTETLITGYSIPLRHAVVVRLRQLENQVAKPATVANLNDPAALRGLLLGYTEQVLQLEHKITEDKPKVEFFDDFVESKELQSVGQVAKILGTGPILLFRYLQKHKILMGGTGENKNMPYQQHLNAGRMDVKYNNFTVEETGEVKIRPKPLFTSKGVDWIRSFVKENGREGL